MAADAAKPKADEPVKTAVDGHGRVTTTMEEIEAVRDSWALAIGRFIVAFAGCEYWTYQFVWTYGNAAEKEAIGNQLLSKRLAVVERVILRMRLKAEVQERADATIARLRKLTTTRNLLAHNAPMVHVYRNEDTGALEVRHELRNATDLSSGATAEQIEKEAAEAAAVEEELALLFGQVRQPQSRQG